MHIAFGNEHVKNSVTGVPEAFQKNGGCFKGDEGNAAWKAGKPLVAKFRKVWLK